MNSPRSVATRRTGVIAFDHGLRDKEFQMRHNLQHGCHTVHLAQFVDRVFAAGPPHLPRNVVRGFRPGSDQTQDFLQPLFVVGEQLLHP